MVTEVCAPGSTAADEGPGCQPCAADFYKTVEGREGCTACPEGTDTEGATGVAMVDGCLGKYSWSPRLNNYHHRSNSH